MINNMYRNCATSEVWRLLWGVFFFIESYFPLYTIELHVVPDCEGGKKKGVLTFMYMYN